MKRPATFTKIGREYAAWQAARRGVQSAANEALSRSKRAIFALHRDDAKGAAELLSQAEDSFKRLASSFRKFPSLAHEGALKAALEEYAEAKLFFQYVEKGSFGALGAGVDASTYLGGLCDATGEVVRRAVRKATTGDRKDVAHAHETVEMTVEFLLQLDLTGYLRTKFDQAKRNQRSLEQIMYELSLKR